VAPTVELLPEEADAAVPEGCARLLIGGPSQYQSKGPPWITLPHLGA